MDALAVKRLDYFYGFIFLSFEASWHCIFTMKSLLAASWWGMTAAVRDLLLR